MEGCYWQLGYAVDPFSRMSVPTDLVPVNKVVFSTKWSPKLDVDCLGRVLCDEEKERRRLPHGFVPDRVKHLTPLVLLSKKNWYGREAMKPMMRDLFSFSHGISGERYKAVKLERMSVEGEWIALWPCVAKDKEFLAASFERSRKDSIFYLYYRDTVVSTLRVHRVFLTDWHQELYIAMHDMSYKFHPSMTGAVSSAARFFGIPMDEMDVTFFNDGSCAESTSILWMKMRLPRWVVEGNPLTGRLVKLLGEEARAGVVRTSEGFMWRICKPEKDVDVVLLNLGCGGRVAVERTTLRDMLYVTVPVVVEAHHYDRSPTLRVWALALAHGLFTSSKTAYSVTTGKPLVVLALGTCGTCPAHVSCFSPGYQEDPFPLLSPLSQRRKRPLPA